MSPRGAVDEADPKRTVEAARLETGEVGHTLIVQLGRDVVVRQLPASGSVTIGRDDACEIVLDHDSVSRRHARIHCAEGLVVEDLDSRNGTRVSGAKLAPGERRALSAGTVIEFGSAVAFLRRGDADDELRPEAPRAPHAKSSPQPLMLRDPRMKELYALLDVIAPSPFCVLILGETGVGKDVFAEALHKRSHRAGARLLRLNCAALAESLLESELFGHERGAFTGAVAPKEGLFEAADGGTVFLDEVGELPLSTQSKLLRVLESGEVMRLGSVKTKRVDVRFISATNRDLQTLSGTGAFRSDLFFRLNGVTVTIPPLRERRDDIAPLVLYFVGEACKRLARPPVTVAREALAELQAHSWPGNIRELRNVVERAVLLSTGDVLEARHLKAMADAAGTASAPRAPPSSAPAERARPAPGERGASFREEVEQLEKQRILDALDKCGGNQSRAAKMLGIPRRTFVKRLDAYGVVRPRKDREEDE